jgi:hypothetical protein
MRAPDSARLTPAGAVRYQGKLANPVPPPAARNVSGTRGGAQGAQAEVPPATGGPVEGPVTNAQ